MSIFAASTVTTTVPTPPSDDQQVIIDLALQDLHRVDMMFYPKLWESAPHESYTWIETDFPPEPRSIIPKEPGVYAFVVMTSIFNFPAASGLFYIGKAKDLYSRVGAYMGDSNSDFFFCPRPRVWRMLKMWAGHLKYFYTTMPDVESAEILESKMLNAFIPHFNRHIDGEIGRMERAF